MWVESPCPNCGRLERHDVRAVLKLCAICLMREADRIDMQVSKIQAGFDIPKTLKNILSTYQMKSIHLADELGLDPASFYQTKTGKRPLTRYAIEKLVKKYKNDIVQKPLINT